MNGNGSTHPAVRAAIRPSLRLAVLIATAALFVLVLLPSGARISNASAFESKPTVVLVHGAWADPSGWKQVVRDLRDDGYPTATPTLDLNSIAGDVAIVRATLDAIPGKKVLVAHSYGGMVISNAAYGRTDVVALVFTAAFVPDQGDSILSLGVGYQQSQAFSHLAFTGNFFASPAYIAPNYFHQFFAQDLSASQSNAMDAAQRPISASILGTPSGPVAWHTLPSWYVVSGSDLIIDPAEERFMAQRMGAKTLEYADASHVGGFTNHADQFSELIVQAAGATNQ